MNDNLMIFWNEIESIFKEMVEHKFNVELANGTLSTERFKFYLEQDELYLKEYAKSVNILAEKAPNNKTKTLLLNFAESGYETEHEMHKNYLEMYNIDNVATQNNACKNSCQYLYNTISNEQFKFGVTALLPCFWIYREVGLHIIRNSVNKNMYSDWINTYASTDFKNETEMLIDVFLKEISLATEKDIKKMLALFKQGTQLELEFWDSAYKMK